MKRKLFSAILFGALLTASTSGLTSCKDYDDDISNLQSQIDKLATADQLSAKVSEMQAAISAAQSAAESKAAAAQSVADAAKSAAADAAAAASKAQSTADGASQAAKDAAAAAAAADEVAKAAQKAIEALEAKAATKEDLKAAADAAEAAVKAIQDAHAKDVEAINKAINDGLDAVKAEIAETNKKLDALDVRLKAVEDKLAAIEAGEGEGSLAEIQAEVNAIADDLEAIIGEYTSMVTAVSLYTSDAVYSDDLLKFVYVSQEKDTKFPAAEGVADEQITFSSANKNVMTTDKLVVRVSPTNAVLNAANISLLNSQGADLSDYVEVKAVKPYEELILGGTRAAAEGNGLWEVEFKVKDGVDAAKFADAVSVKKGLTTYGIKYAVAVQNTESDETRRVISAYDVEVQPEDYEPASTNIAVANRDGKWWSLNYLKNRYKYVDTKAGDIVAEKEKSEGKGSELCWVNEPEVAGGTNYQQAENDSRSNKNKFRLLDVEVGGSIDIFVASRNNKGNDEVNAWNPHNSTSDVVKGFYVVLDSQNAIESAPSEINAWESYSYTNVGVPGDSKRPAKMFYGNEGSISIDSPAALGDIIGFRVYVVNLDGTLVDPDGRAFYVNVATEKVVTNATAEAINVTLNPENKDDEDPWHFSVGDKNYYAIAKLSDAAVSALGKTKKLTDWTITENASAYGNNSVDPRYKVWSETSSSYIYDYKVEFLKKATDTAPLADADLKDARYVKVTILEPQMFLDEGSYAAVSTLKNENGTDVCDLTVSFKKVMPTAAPALVWNNAFDPTKQVQIIANANDKDIYKVIKGSAPSAIELSTLMKDLAYGTTSTENKWYTLTFKGVTYKEDGTAADIDVKEDRTLASYVLDNTTKNVKDDFGFNNWSVDSKEHEIAYTYNFGNISLTRNYQTAAYTKAPWRKSGESLKMTFASWIDYEEIAWKAGKQGEVTWLMGQNGHTETISLWGEAKTPSAGTEAGENGSGIFFVWPNDGTGYNEFADYGLTVVGDYTNGSTTTNPLTKSGLHVYRKAADDNWYLWNMKTGYNWNGITSGNNSKLWVKANRAGDKWFNWEFEADQANQYIKLDVEHTKFCEFTYNGQTYRFVEKEANNMTGFYVKKAANGYFYQVKYENGWKFVNRAGTTMTDESSASLENYGVKLASTGTTNVAGGIVVGLVEKSEVKTLVLGVPADPNKTTPFCNLDAWNTENSKYTSATGTAFGTQAKPVDFTTLIGDTEGYIRSTGDYAVKVELGANDPYEIAEPSNAETNGSKGKLVIKQKAGQSTPSVAEGTIKITGYDCFKHKWTRTLKYKINK